MTSVGPRISIIVPSYNRHELVSRAVRSALAQTEQQLELIVIDDGSSPPLDLASIGDDPRVTLVRNDRNLGVSVSRNRGIERAMGEWIAFLDDDDELLPDFAQAVLNGLAAPGDADFGWCSVRFVQEGSRSAVRERRFCHTPDALSGFSQALSVGTGFGLTVRASKLRQIGGFRTHLLFTEDTDLILRLLECGCRPKAIEAVLVQIYDHDGPRMTSHANNEIRVEEIETLLYEFAAFFSKYPSLRSQMERHVHILQDRKLEHRDVYRLEPS